MVTTNIALLDVDDAEINIGVFAPYDREQHDQLAQEHGATHVFRRRANSLEAVRVDSGDAPVGDQHERRRLRRVGGLLCVLLEDAIGRALIGNGQIICSRQRPLVLVSQSAKHDVADVLFGRRTQGRLPLHLRRAFALDFRQVGSGKGRRSGVVVDARIVTEVDGTCDDLLADGVDLRGLYVQTAVTPRGRLIEESRRTIGIVAAVKGRCVILGSDRTGDKQEFEASELFVDAGPATLNRLAEHYVGRGQRKSSSPNGTPLRAAARAGNAFVRFTTGSPRVSSK